MPFVFLIVGVLFLVLARNGTQGDFETLLKSEFSGQHSFFVWASAIVILGLIGFFKPVRPITDAMIGLIVLVLILKNQGLFRQLNAALNAPVAPAVTAPAATPAQISTVNSMAGGTLLNPPDTPSTLAPGMVPGY